MKVGLLQDQDYMKDLLTTFISDSQQQMCVEWNPSYSAFPYCAVVFLYEQLL